jgi:threonine aldolase
MATRRQSRAAPPDIVDLRSDTVTRPTPEMRRAMAEAEVGDDVYGEDPTVNRLEERAAEIFGREAALFVPSGTMGNQVAIKAHTQPGQEVICEGRAHILDWEMGMVAAFCGCVLRVIPTSDGLLRWRDIAPQVRSGGTDFAPTGLVALENTSNMHGGTVYPAAQTNEICDRAHAAGLPVHLDGARIFNAALALGKPVREVTAKCDSVMFCLSKGLGAPVGSLVVGGKDFIARARLVRKALGGGMRQVGVLAAAGLIALEKMPARLGEDHANARFLAEALAKIPGLRVDVKKAQTNIVICEIDEKLGTGDEFSRRLAGRGVLANPATTVQSLRLVTHMDVDRAGCERAVREITALCRA